MTPAEPCRRDSPLLDQGAGTLCLHGRSIKLTRTEQALLVRLLRSEGGLVTRAQLHDALYASRGDSDCPADKILDVLICKLRRKATQIGAPALIATVWGRGWRMAGVAPRVTLGLSRAEWMSLEVIVSLAGRQNAAAADRIRAAMDRAIA